MFSGRIPKELTDEVLFVWSTQTPINTAEHTERLFIWSETFCLFSLWSGCECTLPPALRLSPSQRRESEAAVTRAIRDFMFLFTVKRSQGYTHAHINTRVVCAHSVHSLHWQALGKSSVCHSANYLPILLFLFAPFLRLTVFLYVFKKTAILQTLTYFFLKSTCS